MVEDLNDGAVEDRNGPSSIFSSFHLSIQSMLRLIREKPFHILLPGGLVLAILLAVVQIQESGRAGIRSLLPPKLGALQDLTKAPFSDNEIRKRAREFLTGLHMDTGGYFSSVWLSFDRQAFEVIKGHEPERVRKFISMGAPLLKWAVTFFEPHKAIEHRESLTVFFDGEGRVSGMQRRLYEPEALRSVPEDSDLGKWRADIAGWAGLEEESFKTASKDELLGSGHERADAAWILDKLRLDGLRVVVSARHQHGFLNWQKNILRPVDLSYLTEQRAGKGFAYWAAILLAVPLAFVAGARLGMPSPMGFTQPLKLVVIVGLSLASVMAMLQMGALWNSDMKVLVMGFAAGVGFLGFAGVAIARAELSPVKVSGWMRAMFIGAVPLAFVIMSFSCSGNPFTGCSDVCSIVRMTVVPLTLFSLILGVHDRRFYAYAIGLCALGLMPHCICDNFVNHSWIAWLGVSPMCYYFPFCVALVAVTGLCGVYPRLCLLASAGSTCAAALLGAGHQLFSWPW